MVRLKRLKGDNVKVKNESTEEGSALRKLEIPSLNGYILDYNCADIPELYPRLSEIIDVAYKSKGGHNTGFSPNTTSLVRIFLLSKWFHLKRL